MIEMKPLLLAAITSISLFIATASAAAVRVVDGDTIDIDGRVFRLHGIDAPEAGQKCDRAGGTKWPCGKVAVQAMERLVLGKDVRCDDRGADPFGRTIGVCTVDGVDVNAEMVREGMAWAFRKFSTDYVDVEDVAHADRLGVWQHDTQTPWDYRAGLWAVAAQDVPNGCPIKGNISENGHIYHTPWSPWYLKTRIDTKKGERWFCDEAEAIAAGWRAPYWGR